MDYSTLQLSIADYLHRSDLTAVIPTFISVAEASLFREISAPETEIAVTGVTVGGYAVLPTDYGALSKLSVTYGGSSRLLDYISIAEVTTSVEANPGYYSFEAGKLRIYGTGDGQSYTLYYLPTLTPLSTSVTTNWLLTNAPDLYLYASCLEGAKHIRDDVEVQKLTGFVASTLESVRRMAERKGQPKSGRLQIKPRY